MCRCCSRGEGPRVPHLRIRAGFLEEVEPELSLRSLSQANGRGGEWGRGVRRCSRSRWEAEYGVTLSLVRESGKGEGK